MHYGAGASLYSTSGQRKYLTPQERQRFIEAATACPRRDVGALCLTLAYTGCRISEALAVTSAQVNCETGAIAIRTLKKRGRVVVREVPVPPQLLDALKPFLGYQDRIWCWSRSRAWQLVKAVMAEADISTGLHCTPKGLRHGFGIHAIRSGVPITLVQRWLGHARLETTAIYLHAMGAEEREIATRMWE